MPRVYFSDNKHKEYCKVLFFFVITLNPLVLIIEEIDLGCTVLYSTPVTGHVLGNMFDDTITITVNP